jgi:hypothetical protein
MRRPLTLADWRALVRATAAQLVIAAAIRLVPFSRLVRAIDRHAKGSDPSEGSDPSGTCSRAVWAIDATGHRLGRFSTCLTRALAARWMTGRLGRPVPVTIGIARTRDGALDAHAWIGAARAATYTPLLSLEGSRAHGSAAQPR